LPSHGCPRADRRRRMRSWLLGRNCPVVRSNNCNDCGCRHNPQRRKRRRRQRIRRPATIEHCARRDRRSRRSWLERSPDRRRFDRHGDVHGPTGPLVVLGSIL